MRYRTIRTVEQAPHTVDGITEIVDRVREVRVPRMPRDWDTVAVRTASGMVLTLTAVSVTWSTWSIGSLLHGGIGYAAAGIFDMAWGICLLLEWMARFDASKRVFPRRLGWALLFTTMAAIFWHGMTLRSAAMGVCGAAVSLFAKVLWLGVLKHVDKDLSAEDSQWVQRQISAANAQLAVAAVHRQVARTNNRAALELLALEAERAELSAALPGLPAVLPTAPSATEPQAATAGAAIPSQVATAQLAPRDVASATLDQEFAVMLRDGKADEEDDAEPLEPPTLAELSKADAVRMVLRKRPAYTSRQVAELLAGFGVNVGDAYVRQVRQRDAQAAAVADGDVTPIRTA